jgi:dephospho-CoA kinase
VLRVALTGGIACGKSVVSRILSQKGCVVRSADEAAHELMAPGRAAWKKIVARFGESVLRPDGTIDRGHMGRTVFSDAEARRFMNALLHPLVMAEEKRLAARLEREGRTRVFVSEAALTVEAGYASLYDKVIVAHCAPAVQVRRLMERDAIGKEEALRKIGTQMPVAEKLRHADYVIDTSGTLRETVEQTEKVYAGLLQDAELKRLSRKKSSPQTSSRFRATGHVSATRRTKDEGPARE